MRQANLQPMGQFHIQWSMHRQRWIVFLVHDNGDWEVVGVLPKTAMIY